MKYTFYILVSFFFSTLSCADLFWEKEVDAYNNICDLKMHKEYARMPAPLSQWLIQVNIKGHPAIIAKQGWTWRTITGGYQVPTIPIALSARYGFRDKSGNTNTKYFYKHLYIEKLTRDHAVRTYIEFFIKLQTIKKDLYKREEPRLKVLKNGYRARFVTNNDDIAYLYFYVYKDGSVRGTLVTNMSTNRREFILVKENP